jgi:PAS domain S-box-containing protein
LFAGQFFFDDEPVNRGLFREQARQYGFDEHDYLAALDRVPRLSPDTVNAALAFFVKLARIISSFGETNLGLAQAVAERDALMESQRRQEADLSRAQAVAHMGSWRLDVRTERLTCSDEVYRIFGLPLRTPLTYQRFLAFVHPSDRDAVGAAWQAALDGQPYDVEHRIVVAGDVKWVHERAELEFDEKGGPHGGFGTVQDITERRRAEEELAEADRRKDEFIAMLSHELRNPLAPIGFALSQIEEGVVGEKARTGLAVANRQVRQLVRIVDEILDVSRVTGGQIALRPEPVTLDSVIQMATEAALPLIVQAHHHFSVAGPDDPIWINGDPDRVCQIITNLLRNAVQFTPSGGRIALEAARDDQHAIVRIRDNGMGIPPEALATVFEMFWQVDRPDKTQGGLGVGLGIARRLAEMHGGTIEAHSAGVGQGAEFVVRLPLASEPEERTRPAQPPATEAPRPLKVLVVDDNADLLEMLGMVITTLGHHVRKASDGPAAIAAAVRYGPDVVLLDLGLPGMSGLEVAKELRKHPRTARARLVALTGWGQAEHRRQTAEAGFDDQLTKPIDPETLERLLGVFARA